MGHLADTQGCASNVRFRAAGESGHRYPCIDTNGFVSTRPFSPRARTKHSFISMLTGPRGQNSRIGRGSEVLDKLVRKSGVSPGAGDAGCLRLRSFQHAENDCTVLHSPLRPWAVNPSPSVGLHFRQ